MGIRMKTEITITSADAFEAIKLIQEYLYKGGTGFDGDALERVLDALGEADRIVIIPETEGGEQ